jgi:hypothetical protein
MYVGVASTIQFNETHVFEGYNVNAVQRRIDVAQTNFDEYLGKNWRI